MSKKQPETIYEPHSWQHYEWHVVKNHVFGNRIVPSENNPIRTGVYLCTCIIKNQGRVLRYLEMKQYNAEKRMWTDIGYNENKGGAILAWTEITPCMDANFDYVLGYVLEPGAIRRQTKNKYN